MAGKGSCILTDCRRVKFLADVRSLTHQPINDVGTERNQCIIGNQSPIQKIPSVCD
jgi:hypothetical protein